MVIKKYSEELDEAIKELSELKLALSTVKKISNFTESIAQKLIDLYAEVFPKKCSTCGRVFKTRNEYLKATKRLRGKSTVFDEDDKEVQEYRNCVCGSTLLVITSDRRDLSDFGKARRELFDVCVNKVMELSGKNRDESMEMVRKVFRAVIKNSQTADSLDSLDSDKNDKIDSED